MPACVGRTIPTTRRPRAAVQGCPVQLQVSLITVPSIALAAPPPPLPLPLQIKTLIDAIADEYTASPDFVTAACWADDLKSMGTLQEQNWHFIDIPIIRTPFSGTPAPVPSADTNPWAITQAHSTVYSSKAAQLDKARQLRFIIHLVGDIHQPLHAAALFSDQFPNGDMGGNLYNISGVDFTDELHAFWDSGAGQWVDDVDRPLNSTGAAWISDWTNKIIAANPVSSLEPLIKEYSPYTWANESNALAASFVYTAPQAPTPLPASYIAQAQTDCLYQVALGGYRLADLLQYIFTSTPWASIPGSSTLPGGKWVSAEEAAAASTRMGNLRAHPGGRPLRN